MVSVGLFVLACLLIVVGAWTLTRLSGGRAHFIDDWPLAPDERTLWRDDEADAVLIPEFRRAVFVSYPRLRRSTVLVTNRRIIIATKVVFRPRRLVLYVLTPNRPADGQSARLDGGLFSTGYRAFVYESARVERRTADSPPYVELPVSRNEASSVYTGAIRVFTDDAARFALPDGS